MNADGGEAVSMRSLSNIGPFRSQSLGNMSYPPWGKINQADGAQDLLRGSRVADARLRNRDKPTVRPDMEEPERAILAPSPVPPAWVPYPGVASTPGVRSSWGTT
jgi:hypothetical protein